MLSPIPHLLSISLTHFKLALFLIVPSGLLLPATPNLYPIPALSPEHKPLVNICNGSLVGEVVTCLHVLRMVSVYLLVLSQIFIAPLSCSNLF